jgi:hypothetical protein
LPVYVTWRYGRLTALSEANCFHCVLSVCDAVTANPSFAPPEAHVVNVDRLSGTLIHTPVDMFSPVLVHAAPGLAVSVPIADPNDGPGYAVTPSPSTPASPGSPRTASLCKSWPTGRRGDPRAGTDPRVGTDP